MMATCDDRQLMLSLVQNAYVTTDDTGSCEFVLHGNEGKKTVCEFPFFLGMEDIPVSVFDEPEPSSPDVVSADTDLSHRHRSYTERKSEKLKKEREKSSRVKRVPKYRPEEITDSELSEMFQRKALITRGSDTSDGEPPPKPTSLLSHLLKTCPSTNFFIEYSKFDGTTHNNVSKQQQFDIFLYIGKSPCPNYPLRVNSISSARVVDLIGLTCWIYTKENMEPLLKNNLQYYHLHIAEEDGQVAWDFPPLERRDVIEKYGFNTLALVEKEIVEDVRNLVIKVNFAGGAFSEIEVKNEDVTLKEILNKSISRRKEIVRIKEAGIDYHLEKNDEPGIILELDKTIQQINCREFAAVRDNSKRTNGSNLLRPNPFEASANQTFFVNFEQRIVGKVETKIDISGERLHIQPLHVKGSASLLGVRRPPLVKCPISELIDCGKKELKNGKIEISFTLRTEHRFDHHKFLCERVVGLEIYDKCQRLIKMTKRKISKKPKQRHNSLSQNKISKSDMNAYEV